MGPGELGVVIYIGGGVLACLVGLIVNIVLTWNTEVVAWPAPFRPSDEVGDQRHADELRQAVGRRF
jgi:hypothetical protein